MLFQVHSGEKGRSATDPRATALRPRAQPCLALSSGHLPQWLSCSAGPVGSSCLSSSGLAGPGCFCSFRPRSVQPRTWSSAFTERLLCARPSLEGEAAWASRKSKKIHCAVIGQSFSEGLLGATCCSSLSSSLHPAISYPYYVLDPGLDAGLTKILRNVRPSFKCLWIHSFAHSLMQESNPECFHEPGGALGFVGSTHFQVAFEKRPHRPPDLTDSY